MKNEVTEKTEYQTKKCIPQLRWSYNMKNVTEILRNLSVIVTLVKILLKYQQVTMHKNGR